MRRTGLLALFAVATLLLQGVVSQLHFVLSDNSFHSVSSSAEIASSKTPEHDGQKCSICQLLVHGKKSFAVLTTVTCLSNIETFRKLLNQPLLSFATDNHSPASSRAPPIDLL